MTTAYTSLLGLALPVTGELSGTWGDVVNNSITSLLDSAIAGTTNVSTDGDVTLTTTTGAANTAREAILLFSGARTALRTVTAPAQSKIYTVINATTGGYAVKLVGSGPTTGLTIPNGASATVAWNGSDFIEIGTSSIGNLTVNGTLTVTGSSSLQGLTVGRGAGAVATNAVVGAGALAANTTGAENNAFGTVALAANTTGNSNTAIGRFALTANTTGGNNVSVGHAALATNTTASNNTAVGYQAGYANTTGITNVALGWSALYSSTTASNNTALGAGALYANTTGATNTAVGTSALAANTTASNNTAVGYQAGYTGTTAARGTALGTQAMYNNTENDNTAVGYQAGYANTTGFDVAFFGARAGYSNTTGAANTAIGRQALFSNTTASNNTAVGYQTMYFNTTGASNSAYGFAALQSTTTGSYNTAVGQSALLLNTTAGYSVAVGYQALYSSNRTSDIYAINTAVGQTAGYALTTGQVNSFFGSGSGSAITTGSKNTIIGGYNGNQGGLDIRTSNNYIVLSDGDGNPRAYYDSADWYLSPTYRTILTRGNNGGGSSTQGSANFFKIGTWYPGNQGARATLRISGATGFGAGSNCSGETVIFLVYNNANATEGFYYSVVGSGTTSVNAVAVKTTSGATEVWIKTNTFASTAVFPDCVISRWEGANTDTGSASTPSGASLLGSYFHYYDSNVGSGVYLNAYGVGVGDAAPTSGAGIAFPATQNASSNANTLDDYEEGTWTPVLYSDDVNTNSTYNQQYGTYTKIGNIVNCRFGILINVLGGGGSSSGAARIYGQPFSAASASYADATGTAAGTCFTATESGIAVLANGSPWLSIRSGNAATADITKADFAGGVFVFGSFFFNVS